MTTTSGPTMGNLPTLPSMVTRTMAIETQVCVQAEVLHIVKRVKCLFPYLCLNMTVTLAVFSFPLYNLQFRHFKEKRNWKENFVFFSCTPSHFPSMVIRFNKAAILFWSSHLRPVYSNLCYCAWVSILVLVFPRALIWLTSQGGVVGSPSVPNFVTSPYYT